MDLTEQNLVTVEPKDLIHLPELTVATGSLSPMERSLVAHFLLLSRPQVVVELGVFEAHTSQFLCDVLKMNDIQAKVYGFDLKHVVKKLRAENQAVQALEQDNKLALIPGELPRSLIDWLNQTNSTIDFALVDARHDYHSVMQELNLLYPRLSRGGFILCHDYSPPYEGIRYAVNHFAKSKGAMMLPLGSTDEASNSGHHSVLVALSHPPYPQHWTRNVYLAMRSRVVHSKLWQNVLKPLLKK